MRTPAPVICLHGLGRTPDDWGRTDLESALTRVTCSVLVVHADNDHHVPVDFAIAAAQRHPAWDLRILPDGGHHSHVSRPDRWSNTVGQWLSGAQEGFMA